jgi:hypothetical protein
MNTKHLICGLALGLAFVPAAAAQNAKPPAPPTPITPPTRAAITLDAKPTTIIYSGVTALSGRLSGRTVGGVRVRVWQDTTRPYGDAYTPSSLTGTTARNGRYSLTAKPLVNTQYRVVASTSPAVTSPAKLVLVRILVGVRLSDSTPRRGSLVRFSGSAFPAHDGRRVTIQRRSRSGRFVTVARTRLRDAGAARSTYRRRVRVYHDGIYRVKVSGDDGDHINGLSRLKSITVHG